MSYLCTVLDGSIFAECWSRSGWDMPSFLPMHQRCLTIYDGCWEKIHGGPLRTRGFSVNDPGLFGTAGNSCFEKVRYWCDLCHRLYSVPIPTCILCKVPFFLGSRNHLNFWGYRLLVACCRWSRQSETIPPFCGMHWLVCLVAWWRAVRKSRAAVGWCGCGTKSLPSN